MKVEKITREIWVTEDDLEHESEEDAKAHVAAKVIMSLLVEALELYDNELGLEFVDQLRAEFLTDKELVNAIRAQLLHLI